MALLTKSNYLIGLECPAYLWLVFNQPEKVPEPGNMAKHRFKTGNYIGELSKTLYPDGIDIQTEDFKDNLEKSKELLKERKPLFEAAFKVDKLYSRSDILVPVGKDEWDIVEVKSGTRVKGVNIHDVSFQRHVYQKAGLKIRKCFLMHINNEYVRKGEIETKELFVQTEITEDVAELMQDIPARVEKMFETINLPEQPKVTCDDILNVIYGNPLIEEFYGDLPEENVFELYKLAKKKAVELYKEGIICIKDIPANTKLSEKQKIQRVCAIDKKKHSSKESLKGFLDELKYPIYYLDFETFSQAVPPFDGMKPYIHTPFQYSLHIVKEEGAEPEHISFLADGTDDPRPKFMQSLKDNLGKEGSIIVYYESFEKGRIRECAMAFPEFQDWSEKILLRIVDLYKPFAAFHYYDPKQRGSASIKKVLPVMSDLSYKDMHINNGLDASIEYERVTFGDVSEAEKKKVRDALEKYCELDTWAEVEIVKRLREIVKKNGKSV